ncbi:SGNH/GDSL hydrolase family protein [Geobacillus sp. C56-T2]|uniref:SGNH/GDSL hydrolase family protein n=1 Tax=Geobacillus sp. C56-T2 TaxID=600773 RepID=UPI0011A08DE5|nr:SGNH/GDSL hydrolase family protein [Geobacillus sp. C56-T2]NNV07241.1 GDSL family lipase [Geobacillus sp. MMMUD3]TWG30495.1 lysophospholipase L1-like esterase [Geobacillus sp. C56-T2]
MRLGVVGLVIAAAAMSAALWLGGLVLAVQDQLAPPSKPPEQTQPSVHGAKKGDGDIDIVALGDSLTRGTGDESGKGYVGYMVDELRKQTEAPIRVTNLAVRGLRSDGLLRQLGQPEIQRQIAMADLIVMTIGGNDLFRGGEALRLNEKELNAAKRQYAANLDRIFAMLRRFNTDAVILAIGLYNPFSDLGDAKRTSAVVRDWNFVTAEVAARYPNVVAVPTFDLFALHVNDYLYSDHFHPNQEGYKRIGERVASLITLTEENR